MYGDKGRSGHHASNVGNHWQDWDGVSPNGRQFKNAFTQEVRDLSGSEYWKARKANNPTECDLKNHFNSNGSANIRAYSDMETPKKKTASKKRSAFERANLADAHYQRLEQLSIELDEELDSGKLSFEDWSCARNQLDKRLDKAWQRVCSARNWNPAEKDDEIYSLCLDEMEEKHQQKRTQKGVDNNQEQGLSFSHELIDSLSDENCFKKPLQKLLTVKEKMIKILEILKS